MPVVCIAFTKLTIRYYKDTFNILIIIGIDDTQGNKIHH